MQGLHTNQVYQFGEIIPFSAGGEGKRGGLVSGAKRSSFFLLSSFFVVVKSKWLLSSGLGVWLGFDSGQQIYEGTRPAPDSFTSIRDHLPSRLSSLKIKKKKKKKKKEQQQRGESTLRPKFSLHSPPLGTKKKSTPNLQRCLEGAILCCAFLRAAKTTKINQLWRQQNK